MNLKIVIERGEDGYYVAHRLSLKGCWSQGKTREEALKNASRRDAAPRMDEELCFFAVFSGIRAAVIRFANPEGIKAFSLARHELSGVRRRKNHNPARVESPS